MQKKCLQVKNECKAEEIIDINKEQLKELLNHFDQQYKKTNQTLTKLLEDKNTHYLKILNQLKKIKEQQFLKHDISKKQIGYTLTETDIAISPHTELRDLILSQQDFSKKQSDVLKFTAKHCREPDAEEKEFWYYCIETNTPLLPSFFKNLATAFFTNSYEKELETIVNQQGEISDDGESIIDKHSGYVIKYINFDTSESYDKEGFKIVTHQVLEKTIRDIEPTKFKKHTKLEIHKQFPTFFILCANLWAYIWKMKKNLL